MWDCVLLSDHFGTFTSVGLLWKRKRKGEVTSPKHRPIGIQTSYPGIVNFLFTDSLPYVCNSCLLVVHVHCCIYLQIWSFPIWNLIWPVQFDWHGYHFVSLSFSVYWHLLSGTLRGAGGGVSKFIALPLFLHLDLSDSGVVSDLLSVSFHTLHMFQALTSFFLAV